MKRQNPQRGGAANSKSDDANTLILPVTTALHPISTLQDLVYDSMRHGDTSACSLRDGMWAVNYLDRGDAMAAYRAVRLLLDDTALSSNYPIIGGRKKTIFTQSNPQATFANVELIEASTPQGSTQLIFPEELMVQLTVRMQQATEELDRIKTTYAKSTHRGKMEYAGIEDEMSRRGLISPIDIQTLLRLRERYQAMTGEVPSNRDFMAKVQHYTEQMQQDGAVTTDNGPESRFLQTLMVAMNQVHESRRHALVPMAVQYRVDDVRHEFSGVPRLFVDVVEHALRGMQRHFMSLRGDEAALEHSAYIPIENWPSGPQR